MTSPLDIPRVYRAPSSYGSSTMIAPHRFPFGRPVAPCPPSADGPRPVFVLGAYPSALHVRWTPPRPYRAVTALAVDNEPTPFWDGADQEARIESWKSAVRWAAAWGAVAPVGALNGPSGAWVADRVLRPLGVARGEAWITDCLDTYRASTGAAARLADTPRGNGSAIAIVPSRQFTTHRVVPGVFGAHRVGRWRHR